MSSQHTAVELANARRAPSPPCHPIWGHAKEMAADPLGAITRWRRSHGDVLRLRLGTATVHAVFHPHDVYRVLHEKHRLYTKQTRGYAKLSLFMGNGLLTSDGDFWRRQRRIAQPAFHHERINSFAETMVRATEAMLKRWKPWVVQGTPFDVASEMMRVTLRVVGETLFGVDLSAEAERVQQAIQFIQRDAGRRINGVFDAPLAIPTKNNRRLVHAIKELDTILWRVIAERRAQLASGHQAADLLGMLMAARDEDGEKMDDAQLRDELMTMFLAGHESTANALTWTWYLLSQNHTARSQLQQELARELDGPPTLADLPRLKWCQAIIKEAMRLYPPAWSMGRAPASDDIVRGCRIPAGTLVFLSPWVTHRHPDFWSEPDAYNPQRFIDNPELEKERYCYFPFGGGPRVCIGANFARMETQLILATVSRRYALDVVPGFHVEPEPNITLRPRTGLQVTATVNEEHQ